MLNTSQRSLEDLLTTTVWLDDRSWKCFEDIYARRLEDTFSRSIIFKISWRRLQDVMKMYWKRFCKTSCRCFQDVFKTYDQDEFILLIKTSRGRFEDVFWRCMTKANIFHCLKSVQIRSYFWSVFSCIPTEYRDLLRKSPYSVGIQENTDRKKLRIWTLFTQCSSWWRSVKMKIFAGYNLIKTKKKTFAPYCSNTVLVDNKIVN